MDATRKGATSAHQLEYKIKLIVRLSNWCVPNHLLSPKIWVLCLCEKEKGELGRFTINVIEWHNNGTAISYQFLVKRTINDIVYCCVFLFSLSRTKKHGCYDLFNDRIIKHQAAPVMRVFHYRVDQHYKQTYFEKWDPRTLDREKSAAIVINHHNYSNV